jgi:hypothetical protein
MIQFQKLIISFISIYKIGFMTAHCITTQFYMIFLLQGLLSTTFVVDVLFRSGSDGEEETKSLFVKVPLRGPEAAIYDSVSHKVDFL